MFAAEALRQVAANRGLVIAPRNARAVRIANRLVPSIVDAVVAQGLAKERSLMAGDAPRQASHGRRSVPVTH